MRSICTINDAVDGTAMLTLALEFNAIDSGRVCEEQLLPIQNAHYYLIDQQTNCIEWS